MENLNKSREPARFAQGVQRFFSGVFLSRVTGLGRDLAMAYAFGAQPAVAALIVAFRCSHLLRRFFGEGALQAAFVPHFEALKVKEAERAYRFFRRLTLFLFLLLVAIVLVAEGVIGLTLSCCSLSIDNRAILTLMIWLIPTLVFICLYGINVAFLQCHRSFFIANCAPAACNLIWASAALAMRGLPAARAMEALAKWIFCGVVIQWIIVMVPTVRRVKGKLGQWLTRQWYRPGREVVQLAHSVGLGALGVGAVQLNAFCDALFARYADLSGPVYLWYAMRFYQLALAVLGIATVQTLVPALSRSIKRGNRVEAEALFAFGFRKLTVAMLAATAALEVLHFPIIDLVFGWGHFSQAAVAQTGLCLAVYAFGLLPTTAIMFDAAVFYAHGNFRLPVWFSLGAVVVNGALNAGFILGLDLGVVSVALATSISAWCHFLGLHFFLKKQGWRSDLQRKEWAHFIAAGVIAALVAIKGQSLLVLESKLLAFLVPAGIFGLVLLGYALLGRNRDLQGFLKTYLGWR